MKRFAGGVVRHRCRRKVENTKSVWLLCGNAITLLLCLFVSCKETPSDHQNTLITSKRDYVWTRDTIAYAGSPTAMSSVFGTNGDNVYIVGHCEATGGRMYHYNGVVWNPVNLVGIRGSLNAISGSSQTNIWVVGGRSFLNPVTNRLSDSSLILHYDGNIWNNANVADSGSLWSVSVPSANSVWAAGSYGLIMRLVNTSWTKYHIGEQYFVSSISAVSDNEAYCIGHVDDLSLPIDSSGSFLFHFDGSQWAKIDSVMTIQGAGQPTFGLAVYSWRTNLYTIGPNIYKHQDHGGWQKVLSAEVGHMSQSAANNIVAVANNVWHYNGADWKQLVELGNVSGFDCYANGKEIFIVGNDNSKTFVVHGK